ncbi:MAG: PHP domain-containing protein [Thermomicrobiales bacterium]
MPTPGNYHTHNRWCDGKGEIADVIAAAIAARLSQIGITSHAPVPFPTAYSMPLANLPAYRAEVLRQRDIHRDRIDVLLGLELDAMPDLLAFNQANILTHHFDYIVGSVHFIRRADGRLWPLDASDDLSAQVLARRIRRRHPPPQRSLLPRSRQPRHLPRRHHGRPIPIAACASGTAQRRALPSTKPSPGTAPADDTLHALAKTDRIIELSTGGWRRGLEEPWPSLWVIRRCRELGIRMTLNSDSHHPDQIAYDYDRALDVLRATGHRSIARFNPSTQQGEPTPLE